MAAKLLNFKQNTFDECSLRTASKNTTYSLFTPVFEPGSSGKCQIKLEIFLKAFSGGLSRT